MSPSTHPARRATVHARELTLAEDVTHDGAPVIQMPNLPGGRVLRAWLDEEAAPTARASERERQRHVCRHWNDEDSKDDVFDPGPPRGAGQGDRHGDQPKNQHHPDEDCEPARDDRESRDWKSLAEHSGQRDIALDGAR